jgi:hypothetical protein
MSTFHISPTFAIVGDVDAEHEEGEDAMWADVASEDEASDGGEDVDGDGDDGDGSGSGNGNGDEGTSSLFSELGIGDSVMETFLAALLQLYAASEDAGSPACLPRSELVSLCMLLVRCGRLAQARTCTRVLLTKPHSASVPEAKINDGGDSWSWEHFLVEE